MFNQKRRPRWGLLYVIVPLAAGLFWLEIKAPWPKAEHRAAEVGIVLLVFGLVELWLRANWLAILNEDYKKQKKSDRQNRRWVILREEIPGEEPCGSPVEPDLVPVVRAAVNGHGRVPRTLVTAWSSSDSGLLPIQHSRFDSWLNPWTAGEEK